MQLRSRIAPTPSGFLHIGNAFNFILTWLIVRKNNGVLRLRIDDLDNARVRKEYVEDIFETLDWLGLDYDEGPRNAAHQEFLHSQRLRIPRYHRMIDELISTGNVYACDCSRKMIAEQNEEGVYPGTCRHKNIPFDTPDTCLRIRVDDAVIEHTHWTHDRPIDLSTTVGDFVIRKKDGVPAYQVASLADDIDQEMNFIVRGYDLLPSTAAQIYLAQLIGQNDFGQARFLHHELRLNEDGSKLSKSAGSLSLKEIRKERSLASFYETFSNWADIWVSKPCSSLDALLAEFDVWR